ncbi:MAG: coenzyme F420-0:L-glutamate ligase [Nitrososphaerales archaeon]
MQEEIRIIGIEGIPEVESGDDIASLIIAASKKQGLDIMDNDIIVVAHKIVSKAEGRIADLKKVSPSEFALKISKGRNKDARMVEVILREAKKIVRTERGVIIAETRHGFVCANAGVDKSNVKGEDMVSLLPKNPDKSARKIRDEIRKRLSVDVAVIISDTFGRPWREGQTNVSIGVSGLEPILDYKGRKDSYGYVLKVTAIAIADELASAAELAMRKTGMVPVAIVRGYQYLKGDGTIKSLIRPHNKDLFR